MSTRLFLTALLCAALLPLSAQTPKDTLHVTTCPAASVLASASPVPYIGTTRLQQACPAFYNVVVDSLLANPAHWLNASAHDAFAWLLGRALITTPPTPPVDTTPIPPRDTTHAPPPPPDTAKPAPTPATWTFCTNAGAMCQFTGLRVVRLADATNTKSVSKTAFHIIPCAGYGFDNQYPAQSALHCDYGPALLDTLPVPVKMGPITGNTIITPRGSFGSSTKDAQAGGGTGVRTDGTGSFRTTCSLTEFAFDDPIVYPGQPGKSHLHMFFGNTALTAYTDSAAILSTGNSTCRGGILNRTAYWTPAMVDGNGRAVMPDEATFYYKTGYNMTPSKTQVLPTGLRMIAGDAKATGPQVAPGPLAITAWDCLNNPNSSNPTNVIPTGTLIPGACPVGAIVRLTVFFPNCWDGVHLDSPDHKQHMAYANFSAGACPATHPVQVPQISEHFDWPVLLGANPATWHLSSDMDLSKPGLSAHADWMMGWDPTTMQSLVQNCLQKALDCGVGGIGGNRVLY